MQGRRSPPGGLFRPPPAFAHLVAESQRRNRKVRENAAELVASVQRVPGPRTEPGPRDG